MINEIGIVIISFVAGIIYCSILIKIFKFFAKKQFNKFKIKLYRYVVANYITLNTKDFIMGECRWNQKCHYNSVHAIKEGTATKVFMCYALIDNQIFLHYINQNDDGKYIDNTFGWRYEEAEYYLIREVSESEYKSLPRYITTFNNNNIRLLGKWPFKTQIKKEQNNI
jgi:hypothetical protein